MLAIVQIAGTNPRMDSYASRQAEMEAWYDDLLRDEAAAERQLLADYAPHASKLRKLRGRVIDVGGGAGLAARFLDPSVEYVVVDPSPVWSAAQWSEFSRRFRGDGPTPKIVNAPGEHLPFDNVSFDAAISFWALNHARSPERCLSEIARVLRPGGQAYCVLEDMPPTWSELARDAGARLAARLTRARRRANVQAPLLQAISDKLRNHWPLHSDHLRITDEDLRRWAGGELLLHSRKLVGGYQSYTFERPK